MYAFLNLSSNEQVATNGWNRQVFFLVVVTFELPLYVLSINRISSHTRINVESNN